MKIQQAQDPVIGRVVKLLQAGKHPQQNEILKETPETKKLLHEWQKLFLDPDGILQRRNRLYNQLVLPKKFHCLVFKELYEEMGDLGQNELCTWPDNASTGPTCKKTLSTSWVINVNVSGKNDLPSQLGTP